MEQRLSPAALLAARDALKPAFTRTMFTELLMRLDRSLDDYAAPADAYPAAIDRVLTSANAELWLSDLLREARFARPADAALQRLAEPLGLAPRIVDAGPGATGPLDERQLEQKVKAQQATWDIAVWRSRLGEVEGRVCRVEIPEGTAVGTGFLVGPDRVLTNHHVVEQLIAGVHPPTSVALRFDYKVAPDGVTVHAGTVHRLAPDWLLDASPRSTQDRFAAPVADPRPDELDHALLRLADRAADEPVGGPQGTGVTVPRGFVEVSPEEYQFPAASALSIVQHPDGAPLQVALDSEGVLGRNGNGTRVRYTTTTLPGSSGSPCFDAGWRLVALHHVGDPMYAVTGVATFNQGIPVSALRTLLAARGLAAAFGPGAV